MLSKLDIFIKHCSQLIESGKIVVHRGLTETMSSDFPDDSCDVLFIDADHSYYGVAKDFSNYLKKVRHYRTIVFHDYGGMWTGVKQLCDEKVRDGVLQKLPSTLEASGATLGVFVKL